MKRRTIWLSAVLLSVVSAFGEAYDPARHGNPIVVTEGTVEIDGNGAVIDGRGKARCATLGANVTLKNFTFRNGFADWGGGVLGGRLVGCTILNCTADVGGGAYGATLTRCSVAGCSAVEAGAALGACTATNCNVVGNSRKVSDSKAAVHGGIVVDSTLVGCALRANTVDFGDAAPAFGAIGAYVKLADCTLSGNQVRTAEGVCYGLQFYHVTTNGVDDIEFVDGAADVRPVDPEPEDPQPDPSSYEPDVTPPFAAGEGMVGRYLEPAYLDQLNAALRRSYDRKTTVKVEGLPSGLKLVKGTVGSSAYEYAVEGVPTEALDGVTRRAYVRVTDAEKKETFLPLKGLLIRPANVAAFPPATNGVAYWKFPVAKIWPRYAANDRNWSFSGWPTGLSFTQTSGLVTGTPKKADRFTVKATEKVAGTSYKNTYLASFVVCYKDGTEPAPSAGGAVAAPVLDLPPLPEAVESVKDIRVGVAYEWALSNAPSATVTQSGLPAGLSLKATKVRNAATGKTETTYAVKGVPTKAGCSLATFTAKEGAATAKSTVAFRALALPAWAVGTFGGYGASAATNDRMSATLTVSSAGRASGKFAGGGKTWSLTANGYSAELHGEGETNFVIGAEMKSGALVRTLTLAVGEGGAEGDLTGPTEEDARELSLWRNVWKDAGAAELIKPHVGAYTVALVAPEGAGYGHGYLTLAVDARGNGKLGGLLPDGTAISGTATLVPEGDGLFAVWHQAPSAYKGGFAFDVLHLAADGSVRGEGTIWKSLNPAATGDYGAGFDRTLAAEGCAYDKTADLSPYKSQALATEGVKAYKVTQGTGVFSVTLYDPEDERHRKTVNGTGIVVLGGDRQYGYYLVTRQGTYTSGKTTKRFSYKESVPVEFR